MSKIFVQIASYRDPQLVPTIKDMLAKKPYDYPTKKYVEEYLNDDLVSISGLNYLKRFLQQPKWEQVYFDDFLECEAIFRDQRYDDDDFYDNGHKHDSMIERHFGKKSR